MTLDMLRGEDGPHRTHVLELAEAFSSALKPDVICFSNSLLAGTARAIKQQIDIPSYFRGTIFLPWSSN